MFGLGPLELMVIGVIAVMLYGKQLPDVGLKVGKSLAELRRPVSYTHLTLPTILLV